jgi:hypothetical protein
MEVGQGPNEGCSAKEKKMGSIYLFMALNPFFGPWPLFSVLIYTQSVGLFGWGISPSQGRYLHAEQHTYRINADIHAFSGIRVQDPSVRAGEDSSCLRPRGHCDRPMMGSRAQ